MLYYNQLNYFNKKGNNLNPENAYYVVFEIRDNFATTIEGRYADLIAYTDFTGKIVHVEIVNGGTGYTSTNYVVFIDTLSGYEWVTPPSSITLDENGAITAFTIPSDVNNNRGFSYPSVLKNTNLFYDRVSTGLISEEEIYVVEKVSIETDLTQVVDTQNYVELNYSEDDLGDDYYTYPGSLTEIPDFSYSDDYTFPRVDYYDDNYQFFRVISSNGIACLFTRAYTLVSPRLLDIGGSRYITSSGDISSIVPGMLFTSDTTIEVLSVDYGTRTIYLNKELTSIGEDVELFKPINVAVGNKVYIPTAPDELPNFPTGEFVVTKSTGYLTFISCDTPDTDTIVTATSIKIVPNIISRVITGDADKFFLFNVDYNQDYPTINKSSSQETSLLVTDQADTFSGNGRMIRVLQSNDERKLLPINTGFSADVEGVWVSVVQILDNTFPDRPGIFFQAIVECETEAEDERLGRLLSNFGQDVDRNEELIMRKSDVNEGLVDNILLNRKRKEMLLQAEQIWPYVGSYRGLVNIINWFGYYDIRIKEYFLNVNQEDANYLKFKQVQIPFQLAEKGENRAELVLVPSKNYKKTSKFGLFYDIVRDSGEFDEFGVPVTEDAFAYTNEEVLIKLFALKRYLKQKFLPLNARIVDITGEGVYYERYGVNSWSDNVNRYQIDLTRDIDFDADKRVQIVDLRPFDTDASFLSPDPTQTLSQFTYKYNVNGVGVTAGGRYSQGFPLVTFPGNASQVAQGYVLGRAATGTYSLPSAVGAGYSVNDIITFGGGSYEVPIRAKVSTVDGSGGVLSFSIEAEGAFQGSNYRSLPIVFSQSSVFTQEGSQYVQSTSSGFTAASTILDYELEDIYLTDKGRLYASYPAASVQPLGTVIEPASFTFDVTTLNQVPVSYFNNFNPPTKFNDAPNIPVGAPVNLTTNFDVTWDETPYAWTDFGGGNNAVVGLRVPEPWPVGTGEVVALEILGTGTEYVRRPGLDIPSSNSVSATGTLFLKNGSLILQEYTVQSVSSLSGVNDEIVVSPAFLSFGPNKVSLNRLVTGNGVTAGQTYLVSSVDVGSSTIRLMNYDGGAASTSFVAGDKLYVHEGAQLDLGGSGYTTNDSASVIGGRTETVYTWDTVGRGNFYQMEWIVSLSQAEKEDQQFLYRSGIKTIDELQDNIVILPYAGRYTVEMIVYDTDNNFVNLIKNDSVQVYTAEADFLQVTRYIEGCVDTWDETFQEPLNENLFNNIQEVGVRYDWDKSYGRWINPVYVDTTWNKSEIRWDSLFVGYNSAAGSYTFPEANSSPILLVSPEDNLEGPVLSYADSSVDPSVLSPTITILGQRSYPEIDSPIKVDDWIYLRRGANIFQFQVLNADYSDPLYTKISLVNTPPLSFTSNPTTWEVLREIGSTVVVPGNQIYDAVNNPRGFTAGAFIKIKQNNLTPLASRVEVLSKSSYGSIPDYITLNTPSSSIYDSQGVLGRIYQYRDYHSENGNLLWNPSEASSSWAVQPSPSDDPFVNDHVGKIYVCTAGNGQTANAALTGEVVPGYTIVHIKVGTTGSSFLADYVLSDYVSSGYVRTGYDLPSGAIYYDQRFLVNNLYSESGQGSPTSQIWGSTAQSVVLDVVGLDGGKISGLNTFLNESYNNGYTVYLEYEYNVMPSRTYSPGVSGSSQELYMDFNMYPPSGQFINADAGIFGSTGNVGWFYDHGVSSADVAINVTNVGSWRNGQGTLLTLNDIDSELVYCDSSFTSYTQTFDEDYAETHLGPGVITWKNYAANKWTELCTQSWDTLLFTDPTPCEFRVKDVAQNGSIQFNEDNPYVFSGIGATFTNAQKYLKAAEELNTQTVGGLSLFKYESYGTGTTSTLGFVNTYEQPNRITSLSNVQGYSLGDSVAGPGIGSTFTVVNFPSFDGYIELSSPINKQSYFSAYGASGSYFLKNVQGIFKGDIRTGDILTNDSLPSYPSTPTTVQEIFYNDNQVTQVKLSQSLTVDATGSFAIELVSNISPLTFNLFPQGGSYEILASAQSMSTDCLGYLLGLNGVNFNLPNGVTSFVSHTYPMFDYYSWFGYAEDKIGSFQDGINYLENMYPRIGAYLQGIDPSGNRGWYPVIPLAPQYSFSTDSAFGNTATATSDSYRLPVAEYIGGSLTWEDAWISIERKSIPTGSSVLFTADSSKMAGKTSYNWSITDGTGVKIVETLDPQLLWNFREPGNFDVKLSIIDTNGNESIADKKEYVTVYEDTSES